MPALIYITPDRTLHGQTYDRYYSHDQRAFVWDNPRLHYRTQVIWIRYNERNRKSEIFTTLSNWREPERRGRPTTCHVFFLSADSGT